jgi:hypothetical protein
MEVLDINLGSQMLINFLDMSRGQMWQREGKTLLEGVIYIDTMDS